MSSGRVVGPAWRALGLIGLIGLGACGSGDGPQLTSVMPASADRNTMVTLTGMRLCGPALDCSLAGGEVDFGTNPPLVRATILDYEDTTATIVVPSFAPVGMTVITVTVNEQSSNALDFEVLP